MPREQPALVFIDTNIMLDLYRVRGDDTRLPLLKRMDANHESLITTCQVEMEFKKNRQAAILEALTSLKAPNWSGLQLPSFLRQSREARMIAKHRDEIKRRTRGVKERIARVLREPQKLDPVYKSFQRLFRSRTSCNLRRDDGRFREIDQLARRRFDLGYPPRKREDTAFGDAFNWEWLVSCAKREDKDLVIVSRDSDYGSFYNGDGIVNDWLRQEFKKRVGRLRSVRLANRLAAAFKSANIDVPSEEEEEERRQVEEIMGEKSSMVGPALDLSSLGRSDLSSLATPRFISQLAEVANRASSFGDAVRGTSYQGTALRVALQQWVEDLESQQKAAAEAVDTFMKKLAESARPIDALANLADKKGRDEQG